MFMKDIDPKECRYFDEAELPVLVLATEHKYDFTDLREWAPIGHQTGGHFCNQHYIIGTILKPRAKVKEAMREINDTWLWSDISSEMAAPLDDVLRYREQLKNIGVDCQFSYRDFEEGLYPIDFSYRNLRKLAVDKIPKDLDLEKKLLKWPDDATDLEKYSSIFMWKIYILGSNCD